MVGLTILVIVEARTLSMSLEKPAKIPQHVAIIMDGNGRWARNRYLPRLAGHRAGTENIRPILETCTDLGIKVLTIYAFSTENWARPAGEVQGLFRILADVISRESRRLHAEGVQVRHIGRLDGIPDRLKRAIVDTVDLTKGNTRITLNVAFNYGGRAEIIDAVRRIVNDGVDPNDIDEALFQKYLYTSDQPDPDIIIRTGGDMRLSNYLIWQAAYAEYYSTPVCWPDFGKDELYAALRTYGQRERRFGRVL